MSDDVREGAEDWTLPRRARPPLLGELVERIDEALATARASEAAVMTVGAAALDAAEQAKRAAELAERASAAIAARPGAWRERPGDQPSPLDVTTPAHAGDIDDFTARADQLAERLSRLQRLPLSA
ncbi:MAG TPA: hypothetical protein VFG58_05405 [Solirubrobacterales bacterium]|nr:hypothetical protein [Solirubrobacterales bacterium]